MMAKGMSPDAKGTKTGGLLGNQEENSLIINGSLFIKNVHNIHLGEVYTYVYNNPWSNEGQIQDGLGYTLKGGRANWRHRVLISDACNILEFCGYFKKDYHRFACTGKVPRSSQSTHQERVFGSDGLPRVQPTNHATMPQYPRPEWGAE